MAVCLSESCINLICICRCFCHPDERFKTSSATYSPFYTMIAKPRNKKQQLRNDIISFLSNQELKWHGSEIPSSGEAFMKAMVDTLWQIDGQQEIPLFHLVLIRSMGITNHICQSIASMRGRTCHPHHFIFLLIVSCSDACKVSTGNNMVGKSLNPMLKDLLLHCLSIAIT